MQPMSRALLVGRHKLFQECLATRLEAVGSVRVAGQVDDVEAAVEWIAEQSAELVLVDLSRYDEGTTLRGLRRLTEEGSASKVVVLGLSEERDDFLRWVEAGACGYVLQEASLAELQTALERVLAGEIYCSPKVTYSMFHRLGELARECRRHREAESLDLTPRELEVLRLIADGLTNRQVAERVHLSVFTVKNHVHNILEKLGVERREMAVDEAHERGWLQPRRHSVGT